ncbi:MAG: DUF3828 domain-containing protein [Ardenticatenaceae bacterium]|nr:DUF3828 domain-containing protein [Ardenticatenaceae bacterium]
MSRQQMTNLFLFMLLLGLWVTGCGATAVEEPAAILIDNAPGAPADSVEPAASLSPQQVTENFYNWYLAPLEDRSDGRFTNPLVAGLYRDSEYLTTGFIARIDETLASFTGGGYDPILLAQDIPVSFEVQEPVINGAEATAVVLRYWGGNPDPSPMVVHLVQENGRWLINNVTPFEIPAPETAVPQPTAPTADMDPAAVTQAFYDWYLAYIGDRAGGEFRNPLVDKAYQDNPLLTPDFITRVDQTLAGFGQGGYDPFLLAQDIPQDLFTNWSMITGDEARVTVLRNWGSPTMDAIFAHLKKVDGVWLIDDVTPVELYEATTDTPEGTVQMFYAWYTDALRRRFMDDSVVVDFHDSEMLTEGFKQHLDEMRAAAEVEHPGLGLGYDPLLCAQDVPYHVTPDQALITGDTAVLTARTSFINHVLPIDLQRTDTGWRISNVTCATSPEASTKAFYAWYLGYIGDMSRDNFRNPLADRAYRGHPLLSEAFVQQVDGMFDENGAIGGDPFLQAQDVPQTFSVDPGVEEGTAVVHFQFGPDFVRHVLVTLEQQGTRWQIVGIAPAEPLPGSAPTGGDSAQTAVLVNDEYGFSFSYPAAWVLEALALNGPGMPDDWPVMAAWLLMPPDVADYLASHSGPPDPDAPVIVAPFNVEVAVGDEAAMERVYFDFAEGETAVINNHDAIILHRDPGYSHVIFPHPQRPDTWIVFTDWVTEFPGREEQGQVAEPIWQPLLNSLQFQATHE